MLNITFCMLPFDHWVYSLLSCQNQMWKIKLNKNVKSWYLEKTSLLLVRYQTVNYEASMKYIFYWMELIWTETIEIQFLQDIAALLLRHISIKNKKIVLLLKIWHRVKWVSRIICLEINMFMSTLRMIKWKTCLNAWLLCCMMLSYYLIRIFVQ